MNDEYDALLNRLAHTAVEPRLAVAVGRASVMSRIAAGDGRAPRALPLQFGALAALALVVGIGSAGLPVAPVQATAVLAPFSLETPLAPSHLLLGTR